MPAGYPRERVRRQTAGLPRHALTNIWSPNRGFRLSDRTFRLSGIPAPLRELTFSQFSPESLRFFDR